jgi:hypothetical protein
VIPDDPDVGEPAAAPAPCWTQRVACAVLASAWHDLSLRSPYWRDHAAHFLLNDRSPDLRFWATCAGLDARAVSQAARARLGRESR